MPGLDVSCFQADHWLDISNRNLKLAASAVQQPDCFGYLMKLGHRWKAWKRRYCVLKDACLYFYQDSSSDGALGTCYSLLGVAQSVKGRVMGRMGRDHFLHTSQLYTVCPLNNESAFIAKKRMNVFRNFYYKLSI